MLLKYVSNMFIRRTSHTLSLQTNKYRLSGMRSKEIITHIQHGLQVLRPRQTHGKSAMHEVHIFLTRIARVGGLDAYIEKAYPVVQLRPHVVRLTSHGRQGAVVRVRVVCSGDADSGEGKAVWKSGHP